MTFSVDKYEYVSRPDKAFVRIWWTPIDPRPRGLRGYFVRFREVGQAGWTQYGARMPDGPPDWGYNSVTLKKDKAFEVVIAASFEHSTSVTDSVIVGQAEERAAADARSAAERAERELRLKTLQDEQKRQAEAHEAKLRELHEHNQRRMREQEEATKKAQAEIAEWRKKYEAKMAEHDRNYELVQGHSKPTIVKATHRRVQWRPQSEAFIRYWTIYVREVGGEWGVQMHGHRRRGEGYNGILRGLSPDKTYEVKVEPGGQYGGVESDVYTIEGK